MRTGVIPIEEKEEIRNAIKQGQSVEAVARKYDLLSGKIREICGIEKEKPAKKEGVIKSKRQKNAYSDEDIQTIIFLYSQGLSDKEIGTAVGRSPGAVSVRITQLRKDGVLVGDRPKKSVDLEQVEEAKPKKKPKIEVNISAKGPDLIPIKFPKPNIGQFINKCEEMGYRLEELTTDNGVRRVVFVEEKELVFK